jgi:hypothetical protein
MKSDYHKGITAGLGLGRRYPHFRCCYHTREHEIREAVRKLEDKYSRQIGEVPCPLTGEPSYMRLSWYREGVHHALQYRRGAKYLIVQYSGAESYNLESLAERTVYDDPALAWKRSWELDPQGHLFKGLDALYVNGAVKEFGIADVYGLELD